MHIDFTLIAHSSCCISPARHRYLKCCIRYTAKQLVSKRHSLSNRRLQCVLGGNYQSRWKPSAPIHRLHLHCGELVVSAVDTSTKRRCRTVSVTARNTLPPPTQLHEARPLAYWLLVVANWTHTFLLQAVCLWQWHRRDTKDWWLLQRLRCRPPLDGVLIDTVTVTSHCSGHRTSAILWV